MNGTFYVIVFYSILYNVEYDELILIPVSLNQRPKSNLWDINLDLPLVNLILEWLKYLINVLLGVFLELKNACGLLFFYLHFLDLVWIIKFKNLGGLLNLFRHLLHIITESAHFFKVLSASSVALLLEIAQVLVNFVCIK